MRAFVCTCHPFVARYQGIIVFTCPGHLSIEFVDALVARYHSICLALWPRGAGKRQISVSFHLKLLSFVNCFPSWSSQGPLPAVEL